MRKRNSKYSDNIGDLIEEINIQDLEEVNGGKDKKPPVMQPTVMTIDNRCYKTLNPRCIELPVVSEKINCLVDR